MDVSGDAVVGFLLPTRQGVESEGAQLARVALSAEQQRLARQLALTANAFYRVTGAREARLRLPVPPGETWQLALVYRAGKIPMGSSVRLSVMGKQGEKVTGGNSYIFRSQAREPR
jgi:hypothetical protein